MTSCELLKELKKLIRAGRLGRIEELLEGQAALLNTLINEVRNNQMLNKEQLAEIGTALNEGLDATATSLETVQTSLGQIVTNTEDIAGDVLELKTKLDNAANSDGLTAAEAQQAVATASNLLAKANALKAGAQLAADGARAASEALKSAADILPEEETDPETPEEPEEPVTV